MFRIPKNAYYYVDAATFLRRLEAPFAHKWNQVKTIGKGHFLKNYLAKPYGTKNLYTSALLFPGVR